jgi:hypothetical protein
MANNKVHRLPVVVRSVLDSDEKIYINGSGTLDALLHMHNSQRAAGYVQNVVDRAHANETNYWGGPAGEKWHVLYCVLDQFNAEGRNETCLISRETGNRYLVDLEFFCPILETYSDAPGDEENALEELLEFLHHEMQEIEISGVLSQDEVREYLAHYPND